MDETIYRSAFNAAKVEDIFGRALLKRELSQNDYNALGSGIDPRTFYMIMSDNQLTDVYVGTHRLPIAGNAINVSWGTPGTDSIPLTVNGVTKNLLTSHQSLSGYATEAFVNSSIATATATFRGTSAAGLTEAQFLAWANGLTHDDNDYVFWNTVDSNGNVQFKRYKYTGLAWLYEYTLNNSSFTAAQWSAINSGITSGLVANIHTHANKSVLDNISSAAVSNWGTAYSHSQASGNPHATTFAQLGGKPTSLAGYGITDAIQYSDSTNYVAARFRDANLAQLAVDKYIECWGTSGWWNFRVGNLGVNGDIKASGISLNSEISAAHTYQSYGFYVYPGNANYAFRIASILNGQFGQWLIAATASGKVGIGTTNPAQKLSVSGGSIGIDAPVASTGDVGMVINNTSTQKYISFIAGTSGKMGIYCQHNGWNLYTDTDNTVHLGQHTYCDSHFDVAGNILATGEITAGSDRRWKENISELTNYKTILQALKPCEWDWKEGHGNDHSIGFIAQEVADVMPYAVKGNEKDGYTLNYNVFAAIAIKALQEQEMEITELRETIKRLMVK